METRTKYKIGDRVKVRKDLSEDKCYSMEHDKDIRDVVVDMMTKYAGKYVTIDSITHWGKYRIKEDGFNWTDEMFEDPEQTIVIYRNGARVIAYDKHTKKRAEARCNPDDAFDFSVGARLALDRLLELKAEKAAHKFEVGELVVGLEQASKHYTVTREGYIGRIVRKRADTSAIVIQSPDGSGGKYQVNPKYFRRATDDDITLELLQKCIEK